MKYKILFLISCILLSTSLQAVILNKEEAGKADLTMLEDEIELFKSIALNGQKTSIINKKNVNIKNLNSELGIFLINK